MQDDLIKRMEANAETKITDCFGREIFAGIYKKALTFIKLLQSKGIPLSAIGVNDFGTSLEPAIYITREHGRPGGGIYRRYIQWNERTATAAAYFYSKNTGHFGKNPR